MPDIHIFSIFPEMLKGFTEFGLLSTAIKNKVLDVSVWDLRDGSNDKYGSVDDAPYGGGPGMVLSLEPIYKVIKKIDPPQPLYLLSPSGRRVDQNLIAELAKQQGFSLLCGRYEGVDARVENFVDGELSLGDFVLQGGEVAAMAILEAVSRLLTGSIGNKESVVEESFADGLLEYPQYTRPEVFEGLVVPPVLLSGNHEKIKKWRQAQALLKTQRLRPDLIEARGGLTDVEKELLESMEHELGENEEYTQ